MLSCQDIHETLLASGVRFSTGVPDSLLKAICAYIVDHAEPGMHVAAANEGCAIAIATGHHLATGEVPLVYLQNSGLGNTINPLLSLTDPVVYGIPMLVMIGWRGEPGHHDEPQHLKQGSITLGLLETMETPAFVLSSHPDDAKAQLTEAVATAKERQGPVGIVVSKDTFAAYSPKVKATNDYPMTREEAIQYLAEIAGDQAVIVSTTGKTSRELFEYRAARQQLPCRDFLTVGSMGHASQIALGVALASPHRQVYCFDGDGAVLMHMGGMATIAALAPANYRHIVLNNGVHDSVGGQPTTAGLSIDFTVLAREMGYKAVALVSTSDELHAAARQLEATPGPTLLEVRIAPGARKDLGRPTSTPMENKASFIQGLRA